MTCVCAVVVVVVVVVVTLFSLSLHLVVGAAAATSEVAAWAEAPRTCLCPPLPATPVLTMVVDAAVAAVEVVR